MELFVVVIAILFVQVWGSENPLHRDAWFFRWLSRLSSWFPGNENAIFALGVGLPVIVVLVLFAFIGQHSYWLLLPLSVLLLLYSFGRGTFSDALEAYTESCYQDDWNAARACAEELRADTEHLAEGDWEIMHQQVLEAAAYRGFERMFAVLFWFFALGPVAAWAYRVLFLFVRNGGSKGAFAEKCLWVVEWPAVRVLGLSFAMTGNFVGCIRRWKESLLCVTRTTPATIAQSVLGTLLVDEDADQSCEVTRKELQLMDRLYMRTLWFWLAVVAIVVIIN